MKIITEPNVNSALVSGLKLLHEYGRVQDSRAGLAIVAPWPVVTHYTRPWEKVLFNDIRDANPFFHLMEALWMLTGNNESKFLDAYVSDFGERYAEPVTGVIHGAYGYRWRSAFALDQLTSIVTKLRHNPYDRQAVLSMWDPGAVDGMDDLDGTWRDRPCNTHVYFRRHENVLDMTVCCRSNDILWGAYGANAVHFGFLLDYMAARVGVVPGSYYQVSNNYHVYTEPLMRLQHKASIPGPLDLAKLSPVLRGEYPLSCKGFLAFTPIDAEPFGGSLDKLLDEAYETITEIQTDNLQNKSSPRDYYKRNFAQTMWGMSFLAAAMSHRWYRLGDTEAALFAASYVPWDDWRMALGMWIARRIK